MPVPSDITALSPTVGSNFPLGSESPATTDDYLRAHAAFIAQLRDGKEPNAAAGTTAQYWRGDKTWQDLPTAVRAAVLTGLSTASSADVTATDTVLAAIGKLQAGKVSRDSATGAARLPAGTTAQRPAGALGDFRRNTSTGKWEGHDGSGWVVVSGALTSEYTTPPQVITVGGALNLSHTLGVMPKAVQGVLVCTTADGGHSAGDEVPFGLNAQDAGGGWGVSVRRTSTTLSVRYGSSGILLLSATTGTVFALTPSSWRLVLEVLA